MTRMATEQAIATASEPTPRRRSIPSWVLGLLGVMLITAHFVFTQSNLNLYLLNSCMLASIGAIALNMQMGTAGQISLGNATFLAVGAFAAAALTRTGLTFPLDVVGGTLVAGALGVLIGLPALRLRGLHLALTTLASFFIVVYLIERYQTETVGEGGFSFAPIVEGDARYNHTAWAWLLGLVLCAVITVAVIVTRGRSGRALRLIRDHDLAAPTFGINVARYKLFVLGLGFGLMGLQGALSAHYNGYATVEQYTLHLAIMYVAMIVVGGMDSVLGAVVGASLITLLPTLTADVAGSVLGSDAVVRGPQYALVVYGVLVMVFVTSSSGGIVGWARSLRQRTRSRRTTTAAEPANTAR